MEEKYLINLMRHLENIAANQKILAETQEKLAMALEQVAENQEKLAKAQEAMIETTKSPAEKLDEIFRDLANLKS